MTRVSAGALVAVALTAGLALRGARLDARPMHHDEANQAVKFGGLLERGEYRYDAVDHHGPTLYYLTLPAAWLRGQHTFASLDETTLRGVPVVFGAATILLLPLLSAGVGRTAVTSAAVLMALSPAMVFYSRMFIQEALFACFTLAFVIAVGRVVTGGGLGWSATAGAAAGLAISTKETSAIVLPVAIAAGAIAWWSLGSGRPRNVLTDGRWASPLVVGVGAGAAVAATFYSSFFAAPGGILEPFRAAGTYFERGVAPHDHVHPWHYYVGLLTYSASGGLKWSEGFVLVLAAAGAAAGWGGSASSRPDARFWARHLTGYVLIAGVIFSAIPYKTPWNLLPVYVGAIALAGVGFSALIESLAARGETPESHRDGRGAPPAGRDDREYREYLREEQRSRRGCIARLGATPAFHHGLLGSRPLRVALAAVFALGSFQLGWQAWRAAVTYAADPRNPYVYAQTVPDAVRMAARIRTLAAMHPDGMGTIVSVIAPPTEQWPLPWYLRTMPHVGYWMVPGDALGVQAPIIVSSMEHTGALDQALGDRYVSEYFGLRPELLMALYVERGLWDRYLASVARNLPFAPRGRAHASNGIRWEDRPALAWSRPASLP
jgi:uncharacterized protein (TIGR03663 family)